MASMGRPKRQPRLAAEEREVLQRYSRRRKAGQGIALRARIILKCAEGYNDIDVAEMLGTSRLTVGKWRRRFLRDRLEGLLDEPRSGAPRKVGDDLVEKIVSMTLERKPKNATHWSSRLLARETGVSDTTILRVWRAFGLQPHRTESFSLSRDPQFVEKVRDVVGLYMNPPDNALVLCVDEKSQIQALDRMQPLLPMVPTVPMRQTHTYVRHGTTSLFAALDIATGRVIGKCYRKHRSKEFRSFLRVVDDAVPDDLDIHVIMDNYVTHKTPEVKRWLLRHPRFHVHFTPTSSSWLNLVECWFSLLTSRKIKRSTHRSTQALERDIKAFIAHHNKEPRPFVWTKTADQILDNLKRYCSVVNGLQP